jgi:hypothetical protein
VFRWRNQVECNGMVLHLELILCSFGLVSWNGTVPRKRIFGPDAVYAGSTESVERTRCSSFPHPISPSPPRKNPLVTPSTRSWLTSPYRLPPLVAVRRLGAEAGERRAARGQASNGSGGQAAHVGRAGKRGGGRAGKQRLRPARISSGSLQGEMKSCPCCLH